jgi:glutathione S-transferase
MFHNTGRTHNRIILWAMPISAWSGKMRSYLTKKGVEFEERFPGDDRYHSDIVPGIGYFVVPVVEMPDGTVMQDSTETMLHFERNGIGRPMVPGEPRMGALAWLMNFFGSDLFLKPGMHYRWNFLGTHGESLRLGFVQNTSKDLGLEERFRLGGDFFNQARDYTVQFGVTPESIPAIEESLVECFAILDEHFKHYPYLLGGRPSVADCGLMTMFYAHLSRDLHPSAIMQKTAMNVFNWTERMNRAQAIYGDYPEVVEEYFNFDALPKPSCLPALHLPRLWTGTESDDRCVQQVHRRASESADWKRVRGVWNAALRAPNVRAGPLRTARSARREALYGGHHLPIPVRLSSDR